MIYCVNSVSGLREHCMYRVGKSTQGANRGGIGWEGEQWPRGTSKYAW